MILPALTKGDFDFHDKIQANVGNQGFTDDEMKELAGSAPAEFTAAKKGGDWWKELWKPNRKPPGIEKLKSEFGYQANPFLTDLREVAAKQGTKLDGLIEAKANYNFYIMRCGV